MRITASAALRHHVAAHGGVLYVRRRSHRCCSGALTVLEATTDSPPDLAAYRPVTDDGLVVQVHGAMGPAGSSDDLKELVLTLEGRRHPHPCAYWNGAALVL